MAAVSNTVDLLRVIDLMRRLKAHAAVLAGDPDDAVDLLVQTMSANPRPAGPTDDIDYLVQVLRFMSALVRSDDTEDHGAERRSLHEQFGLSSAIIDRIVNTSRQ